MSEPPLLLDTHAWVWIVRGKAKAGPLREPGRSLMVPVISVWEVGMLVAKQRLALDLRVEGGVAAALAAPFGLLELSPAIALLANALPGEFHSDPADRLIVASALVTGWRLVTADRAILRYAAENGMATLALD